MKPVRTPHLRTLNRFEFHRAWTDAEGALVLRLKPKGFNVTLLNVRVHCVDESAAKDARQFFDAVERLANTPAPERKVRRRRT